MPDTVNCPTLADILASEECMENLAGLGSVVYVGVKGDLTAPLAATDNEYATPAFQQGKGLYKFDCKEESQKYAFSSLGRRKGYEITGTLILEAVNKATAKVLRAMNNLDLFLIFQDNDGSSLIVYDPTRKMEADSGGIAGDTGDTPDSDRQITLEYKLSPVAYPMYYVTNPTSGGWDSLLASAAGD